MLSSYNGSQTVTANSNLVFDINDFITCGCITHTAGSDTFVLKAPGKYLILVNLSAAATTTGAVSAAIQNNGITISGAVSAVTAEDITSTYNLNISKIITVSPSCACTNNFANITIANTGVGAVYSNANISIIKVK